MLFLSHFSPQRTTEVHRETLLWLVAQKGVEGAASPVTFSCDFCVFCVEYLSPSVLASFVSIRVHPWFIMSPVL